MSFPDVPAATAAVASKDAWGYSEENDCSRHGICKLENEYLEQVPEGPLQVARGMRRLEPGCTAGRRRPQRHIRLRSRPHNDGARESKRKRITYTEYSIIKIVVTFSI